MEYCTPSSSSAHAHMTCLLRVHNIKNSHNPRLFITPQGYLSYTRTSKESSGIVVRLLHYLLPQTSLAS